VVVRTWRYAAGLALLGALASGLVGCTSGPAGSGLTGSSTVSGSAASTTTGSSSTSSVTSSATSTTGATLTYPADVPAEARVNSPAGAMAFARYFFAQVNKAYTTPQAGLIAPLSTANCKSCAAFEKTAGDFVVDGQRYDRQALEVLETSLSPEPAPAGTLIIDVVAKQFPAKVITGSGSIVRTITERQGIFVVRLARGDGVWTVDSIQVQA
jgi:hypothetical protein